MDEPQGSCVANILPQAEVQVNALQSMVKALELAISIYSDRTVVLNEVNKGKYAVISKIALPSTNIRLSLKY